MKPNSHSHLPRLAPELYRGFAAVHWVMTIDGRRIGWLTTDFHLRCREALLHAMVKYHLLSPAYCLMPDHGHFVWMGINRSADLALAADFFRRHTTASLTPFRWQKEAYDHLLRDTERTRSALSDACRYVLENPVREGLVEGWEDYEFSGAVLPGYPDVDPRRRDFHDVYWKIYTKKIEAVDHPPCSMESAP